MNKIIAKIIGTLIISTLLSGNIFGQGLNSEKIENRNIFHSNSADSNTTLIGEWRSGGCYAVFVSGNIAYFSKDESSFPRKSHYLEIADISDPSNPYELGNIAVPSFIKDITVSGDYVYIADDSSGLRIINISDPTNPSETGFFDTIGIAAGVAVNGNYVYVADGIEGLRIINVSDPTNPSETGYYDTNGSASGVAISGGIRLCGGWIRIFDN